MLYTNLFHILSGNSLHEFIRDNPNAVICCGRMDPACVPVFQALENLSVIIQGIAIADMESDDPESEVLSLIAGESRCSVPPCIYLFRNGELVGCEAGGTETGIRQIIERTYDIV